MLVVPDIGEEIFAPAQGCFAFVLPRPLRNTIQSRLSDIPSRFGELPSLVSALGASIRGALALLT